MNGHCEWQISLGVTMNVRKVRCSFVTLQMVFWYAHWYFNAVVSKVYSFHKAGKGVRILNVY